MKIAIKTDAYARTHGHTPRQPRNTTRSIWAIQIDDKPEAKYLYMPYKDAVAQAKAWATHAITILP